MPSTRFPYLAVAALLGATVSLALGTSFAKTLFPAVGPSGTVVLRLLFSTVLLTLAWRPWRYPLPRGRALATIALYGVSIGAMNSCFYYSLRTIPFGIATALEFLGPLAIAIAASRRRIDALWVGLAFLGVVLLVPFKSNAALNLAGVGFALGAGACWAIYIFVGKRAASIERGLSIPLGSLAAAIVVTPLALVPRPEHLLATSLLLPGVLVGLLSGAVPYSLEMFALRALPKRTFSVLMSLDPAVNALAGFLFLGEHLGALQWLAVASVMTASIGSAATTATGPAAQRTPAARGDAPAPP